MDATHRLDTHGPPAVGSGDRVVRVAVGFGRCVLALALIVASLVSSPPGDLITLMAVAIVVHVVRAPKVASFDISTWREPQRLALHAHSGWFLFVAAVFGVVGDFLLRAHGSRWLNGGYPEHLMWTVVAGLLPAALLVGAYEWFRARRGGWVIIDPTERTLTWRRPPAGRGPERTWSFDQITEARVRRTATADTVRVKIGDERLRIHAPLGTAPALAESLRRLAAEQPVPNGA